MRAGLRLVAALLLLSFPGAAVAEDPKPRPVDALIAELASPFGKNREKAALELGLHGPAAAKAVPALVKALKDPFVAARLPAAVALARIDPSELSGVPILIAANSGKDTASRVAVVEALCVYPPDVPGVVDELLWSVSDDGSGPLAMARLRALGPTVLPNLNEILGKGEHYSFRSIWPMVEHFGLEVVPALVPLLDSPFEETRILVAKYLSVGLLPKYPPEVANGIEVVVKGAPKPEFDAALDALAKAGAASVPPLLGVLASTESSAVRVHAIRALERIGAAARPAARLLRMMTVAFNPAVRDAAMAALWKIDPEAMNAPPKPLIAPPAWVAARSAKGRAKGVRPAQDVEDAIDVALDWLAAHQERDGLWNGATTMHRCRAGPCRGGGAGYLRTGTSALAVLALLGNGETHASGKRAESVRKGLQALMEAQDTEGCIGPRTSFHFVFNHAVGLLALADATLVTGDPDLRRATARASEFALKCQNPYMGWRYGVRPQDNDSAVTGWMALALGTAKRAGIEEEGNLSSSLEGAKTWFDKVTEPEYGRAGYTARGNGPALYEGIEPPAPDKTEGLTAMAIVSRLACGADRDDEYVKKGQDLLLKSLPLYDTEAHAVDFHYWHFGSLACYGAGGQHWLKWSEACVPAIVDNLRIDKAQHNYGSWDPVDSWSWGGGRVYATAINALTLETPWRYPKEWFSGK